MANVKCEDCGRPIYSGAMHCPHCDATSWVPPADLASDSVETPLSVLKESGLITAMGVAAAIMGVVVTFLEPAYGASLVGIGLIVFLLGRVK